MSGELADKRVLVLSDSDELSRAIELNLSRYLAIEVTKLRVGPGIASSDYAEREFDLIVVALGSSRNEPVVALARASLAGRVGQVPLLIISDRPFAPDPGERIVHLEFPFDVDQLHRKVSEILRESWMAQPVGVPGPRVA